MCLYKLFVYSNFLTFQMLVVFKSAPILKRALKVKHAMLQLYVLKLLKMQTKYLGRQWRKSNMKTMSAIYTKVRHRLNDDWAYGNGKWIKILGEYFNYVPLFLPIFLPFEIFFISNWKMILEIENWLGQIFIQIQNSIIELTLVHTINC